MTEPNQIRQRWQSIAQQLGLETELEAPSAAPPPPPEPPPPPLQAEKPPAPPVPVPKPAPIVEAAAPFRDTEPEDLAPALQAAVTAESETPTQAAAGAPGEEATSAERERPRGRRSRRGRRSGRTPAEDAGAPESTAQPAEDQQEPSSPVPAPIADEEKSGHPGRGERGRSRRRPVEEELAPAEFVEDDEPVVPSEEPDDDNEELESLANWNVPSWQELIGSLYRPDR